MCDDFVNNDAGETDGSETSPHSDNEALKAAVDKTADQYKRLIRIITEFCKERQDYSAVFDEYFATFRRLAYLMIIGYCKYWVSSASDENVEDIFTEVMLVMLKEISDHPVRFCDKFRVGGTLWLINFLRKVARQQTSKYFNRHRHELPTDDDTLTHLIEKQTDYEHRPDIMSVVEECDPHGILMMQHVDGLSYHEISEVLGIPAGTVRSRRHKAWECVQARWNRK